MPFTPFHLGPALLIGLLFFPFIDIIIICIASVIIDIEPAYYLFVLNKGPVHGIFHTYLMATVVAVILSIILYPIRVYYLRILSIFGLKQETSFRKMLVSSLIGTYSHVFLDMFLYPEMNPLYPLRGNPFLYALSPITVYGICVISFLIVIPLYIIRLIRSPK